MTSPLASCIDTSSPLLGEDLTDVKFGLLTVKKFVGTRKYPRGSVQKMWKCLCECGKETISSHANLKSYGSRSCGCAPKKSGTPWVLAYKPRLIEHPMYMTWVGMKGRCFNANHAHFKYYGGRGITVLEPWKSCFFSFYSDMCSTWKAGLTIDRIEVNGPYCKDNCRWATVIEQGNNKRNNVFIEFNGRIQTVMQWSRETGIKDSLIRSRLAQGVEVDRLFILGNLRANAHQPALNHASGLSGS